MAITENPGNHGNRSDQELPGHGLVNHSHTRRSPLKRCRVITWLYKWLPIIFGCHGKDHRSFHYKGKKFPICARCTGELAGIIFSLVTYAFFHATAPVSVILMVPLILDGGIQALTSYESTNTKRLITGLLFGYALANLFLMSTIYVYRLGQSFYTQIS